MLKSQLIVPMYLLIANTYDRNDKLIIRRRGSANTHLWQPERYTHSGVTNAQIRCTHIYVYIYTYRAYTFTRYSECSHSRYSVVRPFLANQWKNLSSPPRNVTSIYCEWQNLLMVRARGSATRRIEEYIRHRRSRTE